MPIGITPVNGIVASIGVPVEGINGEVTENELERSFQSELMHDDAIQKSLEAPQFEGYVDVREFFLGEPKGAWNAAAGFVNWATSAGRSGLPTFEVQSPSEALGMRTGAATLGAFGFGKLLTGSMARQPVGKATVTGASGRGLSNPFKGKSATEIDVMFVTKGFELRGPNPLGGKGGYVNPKTGRSYHIDEANSFNEAPHVDVNRLRSYRGPLEKRKYDIGSHEKE